MTHYLVVSHGIALDDLAAGLARLRDDDPGAAFTLLETATHPLRFLKGHTRELVAAAERRAEAARDALRDAGVYLARTMVGDGAPTVAVSDELRDRPDLYDAIVLCTGRPGIRDWLLGDRRTRLEEESGLPVLHVTPGADDPWQRAARPRFPRLAPWWARTRIEGRPESGAPRLRQLLPIVGLVVAYLLGGLALAFTVNRGFLITDAVAFLVSLLVIGGLLLAFRIES